MGWSVEYVRERLSLLEAERKRRERSDEQVARAVLYPPSRNVTKQRRWSERYRRP